MADVETKESEEEVREVGRWYIGPTLGKGGYSWVKKGFDKKTGRCVALKFMAKADKSWREEQEKQVITEIESLKKVRHGNVMKLYAYNLSAKYPQKDGEELDTVLLVLEYAPGGELFDILYYTSALEPVIARTYFRQFMAGLEACHASGVCHRDLKPQNLLLDSKFRLKITDFGLSKVFRSDGDTVMKTTYVGTRGYQAPELLLSRPFGLKCDIFSSGVILFILLTGYPPFEQALKTDRWFRPIAKRDYKKFWELHAGSPISDDSAVQDLLSSMLTYDPKRRATLDDVKKHAWFNDKYLEGKDLIRVLRSRHRMMEKRRKKDAKKMKDLITSVEKSRAIPGMEDVDPSASVPLYPESEHEGVWDLYTTCDWRNVLNVTYDVVCELDGVATFDFASKMLTCSLKLVSPDATDGDATTADVVSFTVMVYKSRLHCDAEKEVVYAIRVRRSAGDAIKYRRVLQSVVFPKCAGVITGLPDWVSKPKTAEDDDETVDTDDDDEYERLLASEGLVA